MEFRSAGENCFPILIDGIYPSGVTNGTTITAGNAAGEAGLKQIPSVTLLLLSVKVSSKLVQSFHRLAGRNKKLKYIIMYKYIYILI